MSKKTRKTSSLSFAFIFFLLVFVKVDGQENEQILLNSFPSPILEEIGNYLSVRDGLNLCSVSKKNYAVSSEVFKKISLVSIDSGVEWLNQNYTGKLNNFLKFSNKVKCPLRYSICGTDSIKGSLNSTPILREKLNVKDFFQGKKFLYIVELKVTNHFLSPTDLQIILKAFPNIKSLDLSTPFYSPNNKFGPIDEKDIQKKQKSVINSDITYISTFIATNLLVCDFSHNRILWGILSDKFTHLMIPLKLESLNLSNIIFDTYFNDPFKKENVPNKLLFQLLSNNLLPNLKKLILDNNAFTWKIVKEFLGSSLPSSLISLSILGNNIYRPELFKLVENHPHIREIEVGGVFDPFYEDENGILFNDGIINTPRDLFEAAQYIQEEKKIKVTVRKNEEK